MGVQYIGERERLRILLDGEIDHHIAESLRREIDGRIEREGARDLVFDFSQVTFMDSSGIGVILGRYRKISEKGGSVLIRNCSRTVKKIMEMSGIFTLMDYEEDRAGEGEENGK